MADIFGCQKEGRKDEREIDEDKRIRVKKHENNLLVK